MVRARPNEKKIESDLRVSHNDVFQAVWFSVT
jgi:hypothetical protein